MLDMVVVSADWLAELAEQFSGGDMLRILRLLKVLCVYGGVYFVSLKGIYTGPESTEWFGWGPDPDLAEKFGFLNFFGHLGPVGRPMEGHVDFDHTNFSRRSLPRHPDFLPRGRMSKS